MSVAVATRPVAGLFGKLPAHGDFVRRGWPDETVEAIDRWLSDAMRAARVGRDDEVFAARMRAAPMCEGQVPAGLLGPHALRLVLAMSVDRVGRLFPLVAGIAWGDAATGRAGPSVAAALDDAVYDAVAGRLDADGLLARIAAVAVVPDGADREAAPAAESLWWPVGSDAPPLRAVAVDAALLDALLGAGRA